MSLYRTMIYAIAVSYLGKIALLFRLVKTVD